MNHSTKTKTLQAIRFFNDKIPAIALLEMPDGRRKEKLTVHIETRSDKFFDYIESKELWSTVVLCTLTTFIALVALWGIRQ